MATCHYQRRLVLRWRHALATRLVGQQFGAHVVRACTLYLTRVAFHMWGRFSHLETQRLRRLVNHCDTKRLQILSHVFTLWRREHASRCRYLSGLQKLSHRRRARTLRNGVRRWLSAVRARVALQRCRVAADLSTRKRLVAAAWRMWGTLLRARTATRRRVAELQAAHARAHLREAVRGWARVARCQRERATSVLAVLGSQRCRELRACLSR